MSDDDVSIQDLMGALDETNDYGDLKNMTKNTVKPLQETSEASSKRAALSANYEIANENIDTWSSTVNQMQGKRTVTFEDKDADFQFNSFTPIKTEFGEEIDEILKQEKLTRDAQVTLENEAMGQMSEEQIKARYEQLAKLRNLQFYNEQKARRWKKIKSKTFRKLHKKDMADISLEELAEIDQDAFQARLKKIESDRAKERATLRHKNTSQWVRRVLARGLKSANEDVRKSYEEQIRLGEELTKKIQGFQGDDSDDEETPLPANPVKENKKLDDLFNMKFMKEAEERKEKEFQELQKAFGETNEEDEEKAPATGIVSIKPNKNDNANTEVKEEVKKEEKKVEEVKEEEIKNNDAENNQVEPEKQESNPWLQKKKPKRRFVSASSFHQPTEDELRAAEDRINLAKKEEQKEIIADAFGLTEEFEKEKEAQAAKEAEKDLPNMDDLFIQGWGSWAGPDGIESEGSKRRRESMEAKRKAVIDEALKDRKDAKMPHVMFRDGVDPAVAKYGIQNVPRFYANAKQLESQLQYPIGPEFNSVSGYNALIQPDMVSRAGQKIDPIFFTKMRKYKEKIQKRKENRKALESTTKTNK